MTAAIGNRGRSAGAPRLGRVQDLTGQQLGGFVASAVDPARADILTDGWQVYGGLSRRGFRHRKETQGPGERAAELLPWAHAVLSNLEIGLRGTHHGVSKKRLGRSLREFEYRFNCRGIQGALFGHVLRAAVAAAPTPYATITAERVG